MHRLDRRLSKLESDAGINGNPCSRMSDAELDEEIVRAYAVLSTNLSPSELEAKEEEDLTRLGPDPVLGVSRMCWPMSTDIDALVLKRAGRVFYDECSDLSVEQIHSRVKMHIARLGVIKA